MNTNKFKSFYNAGTVSIALCLFFLILLPENRDSFSLLLLLTALSMLFMSMMNKKRKR
jgi:hypothetical protein